ncbi:RNA-binding protein 2 [Linum grandiflorum]
MADGYWNRQPPPQQQQQQPPQQQPPPLLPAGGMLKRPRNEYEMQNPGLPGGYEMNNYYGNARDDGASLPMASREPPAMGGDGFARNMGGGMGGLPPVDPAVMGRPRPTGPPNMGTNGFGGHPPGPNAMHRSGRDTVPLPPDASNTLYVEGLPHDCTRREVAHIFRPFVGYKDLRLVSKESKHRGEPIILCFVDFVDPPCAATAMSALQGYRMDEHDAESSYLKLQFSRYPGPRSGLLPFDAAVSTRTKVEGFYSEPTSGVVGGSYMIR